MNSENNGARFSSIGYTGIVDPDGKVVWSNNKRLFKRISSSDKFISTYSLLIGTHTSFEIRITFEGVKYRVDTLPVPDRFLMCMAFPEDCYIKYAYSEMYMRIFNIRRNALRCASVSAELRERLAALGADDETVSAFEEYSRFTKEILDDAVGIGRMFENEHICDYVVIEECLNSSLKQIGKYNILIGKEVTFNFSFRHKVAKINYNVFETAILEIIRVIYKSLPKNGKSCVYVSEDPSGKLLVSAEAELPDKFDAGSVDGEIRDIMCAFECLGGRTRIYLADGKLFIGAEAPADMSDHLNRVRFRGYIGDDAEELKGFHRVVSPSSDDNIGQFIFNSPKTEVEVRMCVLMSDIMFSSLIEEK